jgi:hypothetical protein
MTPWLARQALRLYPLAYRRRYGDEMRALLEDQPPRMGTVVDVFRGAARAHLRPDDAPAGAVDAADRMRASTSGILLCWILLAAAGFGYYKSTEDDPFSAAGHLHPLLRDAHLAVQILAVLASAAVVLGALPLILAAAAHARRDPSVRRTVLVPFVPLLVFGSVTAAALAVAHAQAPGHTSDAGYGMAIVWGIAALACGITCVLGCRAALFATPASPARLRVALVAGTLVTLAMLGIAAATAVYAIALPLDASSLAGAPNGPFGLLSTSASLILQAVVMIAAGALALIATVRGWRVQPDLA